MSSQKPYRMVVGTDFSETADLALAQAVAMAQSKAGRTELHVVTIIDKVAAGIVESLISSVTSRLLAAGDEQPGSEVTPFAHIRTGDPAHEIVKLASEIEADLVVVGTHGRRGMRRLLLGSVAERTVRLAPCPVVVVRETDYSVTDAPVMEPICPDCARVRAETEGRSWWCSAHDHPDAPQHVYNYSTRIEPAQRMGKLL